jgi:DnaJ-class molecular chaperone
MENHYQTLNLSPQATIQDVKASYRRLVKQYHPDTAGDSRADVSSFHKVHEAYRSLMAELSDSGQRAKAPQAPWRFEGLSENGVDVIYVLRISREAAASDLHLVLPWKAEEACPSCLGQGRTLTPMFGGGHLHRSPCLKCQGRGIATRNSSVQVDLTPGMIAQGLVRMKGLGHYDPRQARRGDLVIELVTERNRSEFNGRMYSA